MLVNCGEKGTLYTAGEDVNCCSLCGQQYGGFQRNCNSTSGYTSEKNKTTRSKDTCTSVFTVA